MVIFKILLRNTATNEFYQDTEFEFNVTFLNIYFILLLIMQNKGKIITFFIL